MSTLLLTMCIEIMYVSALVIPYLESIGLFYGYVKILILHLHVPEFKVKVQV